MHDYTLVINAGLTSLKFCVFARSEGPEVWRMESRGRIEGIGATPRFVAQDAAGSRLSDWKLEPGMSDASGAVGALTSWLRTMYAPARMLGVGHIVMHGGPKYAAPIVITPQIVEELRELVPLAPLHQPYNLAAIEAVAHHLPDVPQVACFDTTFHRTQSPLAALIPLPVMLRRSGLQRYGFSGLSYEYIASMLPRVAPEIALRRVIVAHLGPQASLCAMSKGKCVDTTLGFSPLDGLCMGTRPGALDPGVVLYLFQTLRLSSREIETILYKKSGLLALSGVSDDIRELLEHANPDARLAVDYFVYRATKEIGALTAVLGGLDGLVFTADFGEDSAELRGRLCEASSWLGISLDPGANSRKGPRISTASSRVSVWVIPTNEELMVALHTGVLLGLVDERAEAADARSS